MQAPTRQQRIAALRDTIADIERKPALREAQARVEHRPGDFPVLPGGLLQEVFTDERRNAGGALGFALAQARGLLHSGRPGIIYLQLAEESRRLGLPYGPGLISFGLDPACLVLVLVDDMADLLWAAEESMTCRSVAAVIAEVGSPSKLLDFTASRRLSLRAAEAGSSIFLLRYGTGREAGAAHLRWHVAPAPSGRKPFDDRAPGPHRWLVQLERGVVLKQQTEWLLGWTEDGFATFTPQLRHPKQQADAATIPRPVSAHLANRLSQTA